MCHGFTLPSSAKAIKNIKSKDHVAILKRRLLIWQKGDILDLLEESETIQQRMIKTTLTNSTEVMSKKFGVLMKQGKLMLL